MPITTDILIVGGGIVGLSIARELNTRRPDLKITILEKEGALAMHASGRNSGVLHAGFYYTPDSLKAQLTVEGNRLLTEYCLKNGLSINRCGKLVVAKDEGELETLNELKRRGEINGVRLEMVDEGQLKDLEPNAKTFSRALYSPTTSSINPVEVVEFIGDELKAKKNVDIRFNERFLEREDASVVTSSGLKIGYKHLINSSGLYADKIAHWFGVGLKYTLIPFKGLYLDYKDDNIVNRHIYPVPDLNEPFLGLHFTKTVEGKVKVGPTAIPALWRENYSGLSNFNPKELMEILATVIRLFATNPFDFRKTVLREIKKYSRRSLVKQAARLVKTIDPNKFGDSSTPGIRAQLLDRDKMQLTMDFVVEYGENSTHILNAVSPAFTCAFSFSRLIVDEVSKRYVL
jgi:L-2-hydroxyglutarate oxidase LhgO